MVIEIEIAIVILIATVIIVVMVSVCVIAIAILIVIAIVVVIVIGVCSLWFGRWAPLVPCFGQRRSRKIGLHLGGKPTFELQTKAFRKWSMSFNKTSKNLSEN